MANLLSRKKMLNHQDPSRNWRKLHQNKIVLRLKHVAHGSAPLKMLRYTFREEIKYKVGKGICWWGKVFKLKLGRWDKALSEAR